MRIMGLDPGSKRVGVAVSDELSLTANGLTTITWEKREELLKAIEKLARENDVSLVVMGLPRRMDGSIGPGARWALALAKDIEERLEMEVKTWDERFSSSAVERILIDADVSRKKRKEVRDKMSAVYILQGYLDAARMA